MKLLGLFCLLAGGFCQSATDVLQKFAALNTMASLPCPQKTGDVKWTILTNSGGKEILVTIENGQERITNKDKYGSQADNTLLIKKVNVSDYRMYFCNDKRIYLTGTEETNKLAPNSGNGAVTPNHDELESEGSGLGEDSDHEESDSGIQGSLELWKVLVGVVTGAVSVLLILLALRFCSKRRAETNPNVEVIYEEIKSVEDRPGKESDVESPYSSITLTPNTSTQTNNNLYSTVNKSKDPSRGECVYYLAQNPAQTVGSAEQ